MNPIELEVTFLDGSREQVSAIAADLIAFETKFDISITTLEKEVRITHMFFLAWTALHRMGKTKDAFEKWTEGVSSVSSVEAKK